MAGDPVLKTICIIPARGGSKRIPRKNVLPLNGIPLVCYTIRAAKRSGVFDEIVVSSEDEEIKKVAKNEGVIVDDRPKELTGDKITKVQVVKEYVSRTNANDCFDIIAAMLPTCPFRTADDVRNAFELFVSQPDKEFLVSVVAYDFPIQLALAKIDISTVKMVNIDNYSTTRSQDIEPRYHPNGAIYIAIIEAFLRNGSFFNERMLAYEMPADRSFDIDYPFQFQIAEVIAKNLDLSIHE